MGSQIVSSESDISHRILVYLSRNNNVQAQARRFSALTAPEPEISSHFRIQVRSADECVVPGRRQPRETLNFRRASLLSRNELESGTFTIVLHATSSLKCISVIYGANFPFKVARNEVKNASFARRSAHRDSRIWRPELIEPAAALRKPRARARTMTDIQIGLPRHTDFATVQYFIQLHPL